MITRTYFLHLKLLKNHFQLGLCPRPHWQSSQHSPADSGEGQGRVGRGGREKERDSGGVEWGGIGILPAHFLEAFTAYVQIYNLHSHSIEEGWEDLRICSTRQQRRCGKVLEGTGELEGIEIRNRRGR
jgi:hypothetical protein